MSTERVNPPELSPPTGFSHAVVATGTRVVFLAGQTALDTEGKVTGDTLPAQFEKALLQVRLRTRVPMEAARPPAAAEHLAPHCARSGTATRRSCLRPEGAEAAPGRS